MTTAAARSIHRQRPIGGGGLQNGGLGERCCAPSRGDPPEHRSVGPTLPTRPAGRQPPGPHELRRRCSRRAHTSTGWTVASLTGRGSLMSVKRWIDVYIEKHFFFWFKQIFGLNTADNWLNPLDFFGCTNSTFISFEKYLFFFGRINSSSWPIK